MFREYSHVSVLNTYVSIYYSFLALGTLFEVKIKLELGCKRVKSKSNLSFKRKSPNSVK